MRSLILPVVFLVVLSLASCQPAATTPAVPELPTSVAKPATATAATGTVETLVRGTYKGTLPCADCPGIEMAITFAPNHTVKTVSLYQERDKKPRQEEGQWSLRDNHTVRVIIPGASPSDYRLTSPTSITALDGDQQEITGQLAPMFVLTRE